MNQVEVGTLTEEELNAFNSTRSNANNLLHQIGMLEVQKARLLDQIDANENQAQETLKGAKDRLGITDETPWRVQSDGKVFAVSEGESDEGSDTAQG